MTERHPDPAARKREIARDLTRALEDVVFNIEHGIPLELIHRLETLGTDLDRFVAEEPSPQGPLMQEVSAFRAAVAELFVESGAPEAVIEHGQRIVSILEGDRA